MVAYQGSAPLITGGDYSSHRIKHLQMAYGFPKMPLFDQYAGI